MIVYLINAVITWNRTTFYLWKDSLLGTSLGWIISYSDSGRSKVSVPKKSIKLLISSLDKLSPSLRIGEIALVSSNVNKNLPDSW